MKARDKIDYQN